MLKQFRQRLGHVAVLLTGLALLNFCLIRIHPVDPAHRHWGPGSSRESLERLQAQRASEKPFLTHLRDWGSRLFKGDLGYSTLQHRPVSELLAEAMPATLQLAGLALLLHFGLGCLWGLGSGLLDDRLGGSLLRALSVVVHALPVFWLALVFIRIFSIELEWLPPGQMSSLQGSAAGFWQRLGDRLQHLVLPVTVLGITGAALTARYVQAHMQQVLQQDYIRLALAKGLSKRHVMLRHALPNALLPVVTLAGLHLPLLFSGVFVIEVIFAWPGMGRLAYEAYFNGDDDVIFAVNLFAGVMVVLGNLLADLLYPVVDPRARS
ncbi:MAG: ABC transporter permease [candidate division KSB1 bacterium]|nr:ABC transporter permease [candidate division KSB1 bacterium]MDZ7274523.1 ABC transporter permease [candidate division KSB1 bacterium]MDZ7284816.1 ABC transporter permease [candidate division KSB1 bacterium]MDZ7297764.1 ABC transporter permease [candidate division KSB1 bacterium]MDZ7308695.1 ABC transporter permease [candidate division KSB1 bacterium]